MVNDKTGNYALFWIYADTKVLDGESVLNYNAETTTMQPLKKVYLIPKGGNFSSKVDYREGLLESISNNMSARIERNTRSASNMATRFSSSFANDPIEGLSEGEEGNE